MNLYGDGTQRPRRGVTHTLNEYGGAGAVSPEGWEYAFKRARTLRGGANFGAGVGIDTSDVDNIVLASEAREEAAACRADRNAYLHDLEERLLRGGGVDGE